MQTYARRYSVSMDTVLFEFKVLDYEKSDKPPDNGAYVYGLYLECCRWDAAKKVLIESLPKQMTVEMPIIWFKLRVRETENDINCGKPIDIYRCPLFRESSRSGRLLTTGHSTNFVLMVDLPSNMPEKHWVKRGVAMLLQLDD